MPILFPICPSNPVVSKICLWLKKHPKVTRYAVIDDDDDELDDLPLFQPSAAKGLTPKIANGVTKYLQGKSNKDMRSGPIVRTMENVRKGLKTTHLSPRNACQ